jgi:chaperonin GroES
MVYPRSGRTRQPTNRGVVTGAVKQGSEGRRMRGIGVKTLVARLETLNLLLSERSFSMAAKLTPLHDRIVVRRIEESETTRGGIIIPDSAKDKPQEGEVIAVGKGKSNDEGKVFPLDVKAGNRILFGKYSGTEIKIDGEEYLIMREEEVLGILEGAAKAAKK